MERLLWDHSVVLKTSGTLPGAPRSTNPRFTYFPPSFIEMKLTCGVCKVRVRDVMMRYTCVV